MIVPGTTISLTLMPTYIEVRDKGIVKKKIPLKSKSYDDVSLELQKYFRYLGKRLAPGVLEDVLDRIGLPKARKVLPESEPVIEREHEPIQKEPISERVDVTPQIEEVEETPKERSFFKRKEKKKEEIDVVVTSSGASGKGEGVISADDFDDITEALQVVESLSDSFMAPSTKEAPKELIKPRPRISINIEGQEEITASEKTYARAPEVESITASSEDDMIEIIAETVEEHTFEDIKKESRPQVTPTHQIKPVIKCKALLLGETGVGKRSLAKKAGLTEVISDEDSGVVLKYVFRKAIDVSNHRVDLSVWSFDLAVEEKLPRKEFYSDAELLLITYAASDRWSFESIDFWLRESNISLEMTPPIVIVANKIDLRTDSSDDSGEEPVSYNEGFQYAEELAKKLSADGKLHPVAFIEASALTGENVEDVFKTAAELFENSLQ
ncbi:hypothetical protein EU527_04040 [Candidatus Thorarchaeota archaeon]|nr:MAG: hypothetical protein EU527_04040 [Candidatus Thorarchaeota archaeon]